MLRPFRLAATASGVPPGSSASSCSGRRDAGGNPLFTIPTAVAAPVFIVLLAVSIVASAVIGVRISRGVRGESNFAGAVYGISWSLCGIAFAALGTGLICERALHGTRQPLLPLGVRADVRNALPRPAPRSGAR